MFQLHHEADTGLQVRPVAQRSRPRAQPTHAPCTQNVIPCSICSVIKPPVRSVSSGSCCSIGSKTCGEAEPVMFIAVFERLVTCSSRAGAERSLHRPRAEVPAAGGAGGTQPDAVLLRGHPQPGGAGAHHLHPRRRRGLHQLRPPLQVLCCGPALHKRLANLQRTGSAMRCRAACTALGLEPCGRSAPLFQGRSCGSFEMRVVEQTLFQPLMPQCTCALSDGCLHHYISWTSVSC